MRFSPVAVVSVAALALALSACPPSPSPSDAGSTSTSTSSSTADGGPATGKGRPPYPNMATAAWGQRVVEERVGRLPAPGDAGPGAPGASAKVSDVLEALHEMTPAAAQRAAELAAAAYRAGKTDAERGTAIALLAAALVLDPTVEGYKERITDAHGLAAYAGTLDATDAVGQSARALVMAAAGSIAQAKRLLEVVSTTPNLSPDARIFMALARRLTGDLGDTSLDDLRAAVAARPSSGRARAALAEAWLDLGLFREAAQAASLAGGGPQPWLDAIEGRALVLDGKLEEGLALLQVAEPKLDEGNRGDALYWLGRSLTQKEGTPVNEIEAIAATLTARPGFQKEGAVLQALLAQRAGEYQKARELLDPLVRGRPMLPVDGDAAWLLVDACAGLGDLRCVDEVGARGRAIDGDEARYQQARAAAVLVGKADPKKQAGGDGDAAALGTLREAHRASPFDAKLAEKVGEPVVEGGAFAASRVRAARKALLRKAPKVVDTALEPVLKDKGGAACRVCRALDARAAAGIDAAKKAAVALTGPGPQLATADLVAVIDALGEAPTKEGADALTALDKDARPDVLKAVQQARADHKDPDTRRRRDRGEAAAAGIPAPNPAHAPHGTEAPHAPHGAP